MGYCEIVLKHLAKYLVLGEAVSKWLYSKIYSN